MGITIQSFFYIIFMFLLELSWKTAQWENFYMNLAIYLEVLQIDWFNGMADSF